MSELYDPFEPERSRARARAKALLARYNRTSDEERSYRGSILRELLGRLGPGAWIEPPFYCDCGSNISLGERFYANTGCVVLDCEAVGPRPGGRDVEGRQPAEGRESPGGLAPRADPGRPGGRPDRRRRRSRAP